MPNHIDTGERCERHVGEAFPPRCYDCAALAAGAAAPPAVKPAAAPFVGCYAAIECERHPGYFLPCDRCWRDAHAVDAASVVAA
ncbi:MULTISPECIES: hypothetical protein [unclassified Rathayibacter]|uniref:hypothetical protein n=1 Tax=unclassified Rathayibacter TaxID=2609250 RepID=UPI00188BD2EB|nr:MULTISPECIES: hypothetical protein [unclassified Rathayibacter]MBF4463448.1 hypothetical protein [Rathayibacter sp. VKM Ac-2879]MBF4504829.1 hypothetical protein [Rathayibacter sp. VKM Ac-2878]